MHVYDIVIKKHKSNVHDTVIKKYKLHVYNIMIKKHKSKNMAFKYEYPQTDIYKQKKRYHTQKKTGMKKKVVI